MKHSTQQDEMDRKSSFKGEDKKYHTVTQTESAIDQTSTIRDAFTSSEFQLNMQRTIVLQGSPKRDNKGQSQL